MLDHFFEQVVIKQNKALSELSYYMSNILMVILGVLGLIAMQNIFYDFNIQSLIITVILLGLAVLLYFKKGMLRTEYEYTFTNGDVDFAQVFNNNKRKTLGTVRVKNLESFGKVSGESFRKLINMNGIKRKNWFLNKNAELYYMYFGKDGSRTIVIFEPKEEMISNIKVYLPNGVNQD